MVNCRATFSLDAELRMLNDIVDVLEEYKFSLNWCHILLRFMAVKCRDPFMHYTEVRDFYWGIYV